MATTLDRTPADSRGFRRNVPTRVTDRSARITLTSFPTALGWMSVAWSEDALHGTVFGHTTRRQAEDALVRVHRLPRQLCHFATDGQLEDAPSWIRRLIDDLRRFADGQPTDFSYVPIQQDHLTPFARRVIAACRRITWGQVTSYGKLASTCGAAGAARAVGTVMAQNRFPLIVPCHRVLGAGGRLGGYSAPGGLQTKQRLLAMEAEADDVTG